MKKEYIFAGTSIFFWSTVPTVTKLLMGNSINSFQLLWASSLFACLSLLLFNLFSGNLKKMKHYRLKDLAIMALIGLPGTFFYYVFYYAGAARMLASQAFIVNYLWPIMSVVFACILLKERLTVRKVFAIVLSFLGVAIATSSELTSLNTNSLIGMGLCIAGAVSYGIFTALNQKFPYDKRISMMINTVVTFLLTTAINAVNNALFLPTAVQTLGIAWNGMLSIGIATTTWAMALDAGKTEKISNLAYITPFLSLVWTTLFLKEPFDPLNIVGLVIIVAGILLQFTKKKKA